MVDAAPQLRGCPHVEPTLLAARGEKTGKLPRDFDQMGKSPALKYLAVFCARSSGTSHLPDAVQISRLRTIPTGTAGKHCAVHMPHIFPFFE